MHIQGRPRDLGDNFVVRRALPHSKQHMVGPFIFWDHMGPTTITPETEMVVRAHPHIGLSTITYLFSGEIVHRDSLGNEVTIRPGEVNWMTAGHGIAHSERSQIQEGTRPLEGLQVWVALPQESEEIDPSFVHYKEKELPKIFHDNYQLRLIAGEAFAQRSPLPVFSPLFYLSGQSLSGGSFNFPVAPGQEGALYMVNGTIKVEGQDFKRFDLLVFNKGEDICFHSTGPCEFMIFGGAPFAEGRHIWWNFVSHAPEKIEVAKTRWQTGEFPAVINETDRIPLPDN
jgi:redox-sensitive bicupin YhaK (pirin superfamily)